jgi:hypothetical protein
MGQKMEEEVSNQGNRWRGILLAVAYLSFSPVVSWVPMLRSKMKNDEFLSVLTGPFWPAGFANIAYLIPRPFFVVVVALDI